MAMDPTAAVDAHRRDWLGRAFAGERGRVARLILVDGVAAGFAVIGEFFSNPFLDLIVVAEAFRRRGVASALMSELERAYADRKLFVSTNVSNAPMRRLLEARGYLPAGQVDHLDPGDPELFYVRLPAS
jgi:ribosomal protein S18 acetylase RimI-like enzyme